MEAYAVYGMKINKWNLMIYSGFFCLLMPTFMISFAGYLFPGASIYLWMAASLVFSYFYASCGKICLKISIPKLLKKPGLVWMLIIIIVLMHNYDLKESITARQPICYISLFILFFILSQTITWVKFFWGVVKIFCTFHLITGIFFLFNKSMLLNNIIPLFHVDENVISLLYQAIENGFMTGLCYHYSTMGMYMALGVVAFSDMLLLQKSTWIQKIGFFSMFLGLLLTGKRGPLLAVVLALLIVYLTTNKLLNRKKLFRVFAGLIFIFALIMVAYYKIPQVQSTINRFIVESSDINSFSSGRVDYFYVNAISMFLEKPLFGNGWRFFRHNIEHYSGGIIGTNDAHNIFLELLADTGIIGLTIFICFFAMSIFVTYTTIKKITGSYSSNAHEVLYLKKAFVYQLFFLMYGLSGNSLYDEQCYIPYFVCCIAGYTYNLQFRNRIIRKRPC